MVKDDSLFGYGFNTSLFANKSKNETPKVETPKEEKADTTTTQTNPLGITIPTTESDTTAAENTPVPPLPEGSPESFRQGQGVGQVEAERRRKEQAKDDTKADDTKADKKAETTEDTKEDTKPESTDYIVINNRVISKISIIFLLNSSFNNCLKLLTY